MATPDPLITTPWQDISYGSQTAVLIKEVSGTSVTSGRRALDVCGIGKGSPYPDDQLYICDNWNVSQISINYYRITYSFTRLGGGEPNQLAQLPTIQWSPNIIGEAADRDVDGNPLTNSALSPIDPAPQFFFNTAQLDITRFESTPFKVARALQFQNCVNESAFTIQGMQIDAGQCLCTRIAPTDAYTTKDSVVGVRYSFELRENGHDYRVLDQGFTGFRDWGIGGPQPTNIFNPRNPNKGNTSQITDPVLLNGKGKPIKAGFIGEAQDELVSLNGPPAGATIEESPDKQSVYLIYKRHKRANFVQLGL